MRIFYKITLLLILSTSLFGQSPYNWIIPNKPYLKFYVIDDGIYRINKSDFIQAGIIVNFDPRTVKVYYKGIQQPIFFQGEEDGSFDDTDFFDFYGTRNYGGLTNTYKDSNGVMVVDYVTNEYYNFYSDTNVYWVGWDGDFGLRFPKFNYNSQIRYPQNNFLNTLHFEQDLYYCMGETYNPNSDFRYFNNEKVTGEGWFWVSMFSQTVVSQTFIPTNLAVNSIQQSSFRIFAFPNSSDTIPNEHRIVLKVNGTTINTLIRSHYNKFDTTVNFSSSLLSANTNNTISATYTPNFSNTYLTPNVNFDLMEIQYPQTFTFQNNEISFNIRGTDTTSKIYTLIGVNNANPLSIYDTKNNLQITAGYSINYDTLLFTGKGNGNFQVINKYITKKPFRIEQRQVPNLIATNNSADYIVIYNQLFESQAEQLRSHRQQFDNFRAVKTDVNDIIDIFNYGITDPVAIRNFISYAYTNWQQPAVGYVCLLGRGSLDPKNNLLTQNYYQNLIPVYGNPQTDGYFANNNYGTFTYYQKISIGRIPAYTQSEAQDIVNKIIQYDANTPSTWFKRYIMITGGSARIEQQSFQSEANQFINTYINPPPLSMIADKIYRNDSAGYITFNYSDSILNEIDRGGLIVNFIGHAASQNWELGLTDPNTLSNGQMDPLVWSMTCFTGQNSVANYRSFGEQFLYLVNKGAIGFVGTTGWSFSGPGNTLNSYMLEAMDLDSMRRIGDLLRYGTLKLSIDSNDFSTRNTIDCYGLLGDPATKILLPRIPDFDIEQSDYWISDPYPAVKEQVMLKIYPKNLGTYADSCKVEFQILKNSILYKFSDTILRHFAFLDTANYNFKLDTIGNYSLKIILDVADWYPNENKSNNILIIPLPLRNISYLPIKPFDNSIIRDDSVQIVGLNPGVNPRKNNIRIIIQVDTSNSFINPMYTTNTTNISGVVTRFNFHPPILDSNLVYIWRSNVIINNDTTGWSSVQRFIFNPAAPYNRPIVSKNPGFSPNNKNIPNNQTVPNNKVAPNNKAVPNNPLDKNNPSIKNNQKVSNVVNSKKIITSNGLLYDSSLSLYYRLPDQFNYGDLLNVYYTGSGFELVNFNGNLSSHSYGSNSSEASYLIINDTEIYADAGNLTGLTIAKARKLTGTLIDFHNFRMSTPQSSDSVLNYLNTFDTTEYLLSMKATYVNNADSLHQSAKMKFRQFGSIYADTVSTFGWFDTWAFIGFLGATPNMVSESYHRPDPNCPAGYCPSDAHLSPTVLHTSGSINFFIGPAHRWKNFFWDDILYPNSAIKYDVYTIGQTLDTTLIYNNLTYNNFINLDTLNSYIYPYLILKAKLSVDSIVGLRSPTFRMMDLKFTPPAEILPDNYSFIKSDSIVPEGKPVTFSVQLYNVGYVPANVIMNTWYAITSNGLQTLKIDTVSTPLLVDSSRTLSVTFSSLGLRNRQKRVDTITVFYEATTLGGVNDFYPFNNFADTKLVITGDSLPPSIDVSFDGQKILPGDVVSSKPLIIYKFIENNYLTYDRTDTSNIYILLDNSRVYYNLNGQMNPQISFNPINSQNVKAQITFQPTLSEGNHIFQFIGKDKNGGSTDTSNYPVVVSFGFIIQNLYNIPNPTRGETYFTFNLLSEKSPPICKIKIYTVAGRLIKEIDARANVGFNSIYWDGRDGDGDNIANGIYLYKLIIQDGDKNTTSIQKLAKLK